MNYLKYPRVFICLLLLSFESNAELKPYSAIYDVYNKGFHIGEATQTLTQFDTFWSIELSIKATGFASFLQNQPETHQQTFTYQNQQPHLFSFKSDTGKSSSDAKITAYYDTNNQQLLVSSQNNNSQIKSKEAPKTYLLSQMTAATLLNNQPQSIDIFDKGIVSQKSLTLINKTNDIKTVEISSKDSSKKLKYYFKTNNLHVPTKIERLKNNKVKAYLSLKHFELNLPSK